MSIKLYQLDKLMKTLLAAFLSLLTVALIVGLIYLMETSSASVEGTVTRWNGDSSDIESGSIMLEESYPKPISEMLITTHNHLFGFAFIFIGIGLVFYFNSTLTGFLKKLVLIEPFISAVLTFGSIWLMRFVDDSFVYLTILSAVLMYTSYFIMFAVCMYELLIKKN